jgi:hypothetical protein
MNTILEERIGYGGNSSNDTGWGESPSPLTSSILPDFKLSTNTRNFQETKKTLQAFHEKMASYPKIISYDASVVFCVLLSLNKIATANMSALPIRDQEQIKSCIPDTFKNYYKEFTVEFDDQKDFILTFSQTNSDLKTNTKYTLNLFNTVINPNPKGLPGCDNAEDVKVENTEKEIIVGGKRIFNKKDIMRKAGIEPPEDFPKIEEKHRPSNKNPYELRTDILSMGVNIINTSIGTSELDSDAKTEKILAVASKLYDFVENKRKSI